MKDVEWHSTIYLANPLDTNKFIMVKQVCLCAIHVEQL